MNTKHMMPPFRRRAKRALRKVRRASITMLRETPEHLTTIVLDMRAFDRAWEQFSRAYAADARATLRLERRLRALMKKPAGPGEGAP